MRLFALEHSKVGYWSDFVAYGAAIALLTAGLVVYGPHAERSTLAGIALLGVTGWSLIEYGMHRFVLHGIEPFRSWHAEHHDRPHALISAPTLLSATLIVGLVFLPGLLALGTWPAAALTLGVTSGYLAYAITHHATHHWPARSKWLRQRKHWHARHHHAPADCFGVSSSLWDRVLGSGGRSRVTPSARR